MQIQLEQLKSLLMQTELEQLKSLFMHFTTYTSLSVNFENLQ